MVGPAVPAYTLHMTQSTGQGVFAAPPRTVGAALAARMMLGSARSQVGWLVLAIGSILFWGVIRHADISGFRFQAGHVVKTSGKFLSCTETGFSLSQGHWRPTIPILRYRFQYEILGRTFEGFSFAKAPCKGGRLRVEYLMGHPEVSRIAGMRRQIYSPWVLLLAAIPVGGLFLILTAAAEGRMRVQLLRDGLTAAGKLIDKTRTNMSSGNRQVYRMTVEFTAQGGATGRVTTRTASPEKLEDRAGAPLVYDPTDLRRAALVSSLPGTVAADGAGQPVASASRWYLVLPALTLLGNVWYVFRHF